jgi:arylsulfatase
MMKSHDILAVLTLLSAVFAAPCLYAGNTSENPNIIMILTDDMAWGELGMSGNKRIKTPHIDRLSKECLRFTNFNVAPSCSPSRAEIMSGKHEFYVGVTHTTLDRENLRDDITILPQVMKQGGYQTGMFGKWHLAAPDREKGLTGKPLEPHLRGFDTAIFTRNQLKRFDPILSNNGTMTQYEGYCGDIVFDEGIKWMESCSADKPYFAYLATSIPHVPLAAPQRFKDLYAGASLTDKQKTYYAMISAVDENVGKLMTWMASREDDRETILIFMTDNGHAISGAPGAGHDRDGRLRENGLYNFGFRGGKGQSWRGSTCVPFFIRWSGVTTPNAECKTLASGMDILPTFAEIAGVQIEDLGIQGISLLADIKGGKSNVTKDRLLFTHVGRWGASDQLESYKYRYAAIFNNRYRLTWGEKGQPELKDYTVDRGEEKDVTLEHPELVQRFKQEYEKWWEAAKTGMVNDLEKIRAGEIKRR